MTWKGLIIAALLLTGCAAGGTGSGATPDRESSIASGVWRKPATQAADTALRGIEAACTIKQNNGYEAGACAQEKLLLIWPETQSGAGPCTGVIGVRPMASCLLDFGYWTYISQLIGEPTRGNWATFDLNDNSLFRHWFTEIHTVCDPAGTAPEATFYACARAEARRQLSVTESALEGCPERLNPQLAVICYWDGSYNNYVLAQLAKVGG